MTKKLLYLARQLILWILSTIAVLMMVALLFLVSTLTFRAGAGF